MKTNKLIPTFLLLLSLCCGVITILHAQNRSVTFEPLPFDKVLEKAREMQREVFLDAYTSWCGPCKRMVREVFTVDSVADYFNARFVNVKYDMEKEEQDLVKKYQIAGYPTFLILDSEGRVLKRFTGYHAPDDWMKLIRGQAPAYSLSELEKQYYSGERSLEFIGDYLKALQKEQQFEKAKNVFTNIRLYTTEQEISERKRWKLFCTYQRSLDAADSRFFLNHINLFRDIIGGNEVDNQLDLLYSLKATDFAYWEQRFPSRAFDMQALDSIISQLRRLDFDKSANTLVLLLMEKKIREKELKEAVGFLKTIREVRLMNNTYYLQYFSIYANRIIDIHPRKPILKALLTECDQLISIFPDSRLLYQQKYRLCQLLKDKAGQTECKIKGNL